MKTSNKCNENVQNMVWSNLLIYPFFVTQLERQLYFHVLYIVSSFFYDHFI